jgi:hypothetical protein
MNKKKLILKMAIPAAIIFIIAIVGLSLEEPVENGLYQQHVARLNQHITDLTQKHQTYLAEIAGKIAANATGEISTSRVVGELQSEIMFENQKIGEAKKYLWMSDQRGEFVFGVPAQAFARLNEGFDKNRETIVTDGYYKDRNDFLLKLVDKHENLDFSNRAIPEQERHGYDYGREGKIEWRFYKELKEQWEYARPRTFVLSAPITNATGAVAGLLYMKVDDSVNDELYYSRSRAESSYIYHKQLAP